MKKVLVQTRISGPMMSSTASRTAGSRTKSHAHGRRTCSLYRSSRPAGCQRCAEITLIIFEIGAGSRCMLVTYACNGKARSVLMIGFDLRCRQFLWHIDFDPLKVSATTNLAHIVPRANMVCYRNGSLERSLACMCSTKIGLQSARCASILLVEVSQITCVCSLMKLVQFILYRHL